MKEGTFSYRRLMFTTFIISGCSIIYELLISSVSSYLLGDSIAQFSITIGLYMCAMGMGSYLSKYVRTELFDWFVFVEIGVGILGGTSSLLLFLANIYVQSYQLVMYLEIILIGMLVGLEIPLLTRIIEENAGNLRITLSSIFSFDCAIAICGRDGATVNLRNRITGSGYMNNRVFPARYRITAICQGRASLIEEQETSVDE